MSRIAALASLIAMGAFTPRALSRTERQAPALPSPSERNLLDQVREERDHSVRH